MKTFSIVASLILLCSVSGASAINQPAAASDPHMTQEERAKVIKWMHETKKEYLESIQNLTEAQWRYKPSPFRWSVGEVAEHIMRTEKALFAVVERALTQNPNPDWERQTAGKAQFIERVMPSRTGRAQAPVEVRPTGKLSRDEVIKQYNEIRARVLEFAEKTDKPLKAHTIDHPFPVFGTLNAYDWLIYIPLHNARHNKQIAEVKASPGYPK
ncbi:MAG TPA: DinB family protein [Blastocatellia bacterium]|nr:DinB family protein [Blastocatellia bacterium]